MALGELPTRRINAAPADCRRLRALLLEQSAQSGQQASKPGGIRRAAVHGAQTQHGRAPVIFGRPFDEDLDVLGLGKGQTVVLLGVSARHHP